MGSDRGVKIHHQVSEVASSGKLTVKYHVVKQVDLTREPERSKDKGFVQGKKMNAQTVSFRLFFFQSCWMPMKNCNVSQKLRFEELRLFYLSLGLVGSQVESAVGWWISRAEWRRQVESGQTGG